ALSSILLLRRERVRWPRIVQLIPFFLLALATGLLAIWWERYHQGTRGALFALGPVERLLIASRALWFYVAKLFWPANLTFIYPQWTVSSRDPLAYTSLIAIAAVCVAMYLFRARVAD